MLCNVHESVMIFHQGHSVRNMHTVVWCCFTKLLLAVVIYQSDDLMKNVSVNNSGLRRSISGVYETSVI